MRKYLIGALAGAALVFGTQVFAAGLIGKEVQGEITVVFDGTELSTTGVVIDGVSYLPLRAIGTVLGLGVDYADGTVTLTSPQKEAEKTLDTVQEAVQQELERIEKEKAKQEIEAKIADIENQLTSLYASREAETHPSGLETIQTVIDLAEKKLAELRAELSDLESSNG